MSSDTEPQLKLHAPETSIEYGGALETPDDVQPDDAPYDGPPILGPDGNPAPSADAVSGALDMQVGIQIAEDGSGVAVKLGTFVHVFNSVSLIDLGLLLASAGMEAFKIQSANIMSAINSGKMPPPPTMKE